MWCGGRLIRAPASWASHTKVGTFTQALYDEAKEKSWTVISKKKAWKILAGCSRACAIKLSKN